MYLFSGEFWRRLRKEKDGETIIERLSKIEEELNKEQGMQKPDTAVAVKPMFSGFLTSKSDYLPDDVTDFLKKIDIGQLRKIQALRNIVAHRWDSDTELGKHLKVKKRLVYPMIKKLCLDTLNDLIGLNLK